MTTAAERRKNKNLKKMQKRITTHILSKLLRRRGFFSSAALKQKNASTGSAIKSIISQSTKNTTTKKYLFDPIFKEKSNWYITKYVAHEYYPWGYDNSVPNRICCDTALFWFDETDCCYRSSKLSSWRWVKTAMWWAENRPGILWGKRVLLAFHIAYFRPTTLLQSCNNTLDELLPWFPTDHSYRNRRNS